MTVIEALNQFWSEHPVGKTYAISKEDIKEGVKSILGYRPRHNDFEDAFKQMRDNDNKYLVGYSNNLGWYRSKTGIDIDLSLNKQIFNRNKKRLALRR